jgi:hypothetical protein
VLSAMNKSLSDSVYRVSKVAYNTVLCRSRKCYQQLSSRIRCPVRVPVLVLPEVPLRANYQEYSTSSTTVKDACSLPLLQFFLSRESSKPSGFRFTAYEILGTWWALRFR